MRSQRTGLQQMLPRAGSISRKGSGGKKFSRYSVGRQTDLSSTIIGDELERIVRWEEGGDLSKLTGTSVRLRFVMKDADLFSMCFR